MNKPKPAEPIETMLGYKQSVGGSEAYHFTMTRKFIRVIAGIAIPVFDRVKGACVVVGESYRPSGPPSWVVLAATCGDWTAVTNAMAQYRQDLKFNCVVVDSEEHRKMIYRMKGMRWGMGEIPLRVDPAPKYASSEVGRSLVDEMIAETRLSGMDNPVIAHAIELEPQMGSLAIQFAISWARDWPAFYAPIRKREKASRPLGMVGLE